MLHQPTATLLPPIYIYKLPPEVLLEIFRLFSPTGETTTDPFRFCLPASVDDARKLSQVCSSWRAIALSLKRLWTDIPILNDYWAGLSLERSRPLPVSISISLDGPQEDLLSRDDVDEPLALYNLHDGVQRALSEAHRIRALQVLADTFDSGDRLLWLVHKGLTFMTARPMPLLEYLDVDLKWHAFPRNLLPFMDRYSPGKLRYLSLYGVHQGNLPCLHLLPKAPLTSLKLGYQTLWESMDEALATLSLLPTLEVLVMERAPDESDEPGPIFDIDVVALSAEPRSVALPNLRTLQLTDTLEITAYLMRSLVFPTAAQIKLYTFDTDRDTARGFLNVLIASIDAHYRTLIADGCLFRGLLLEVSCVTMSGAARRIQLGADHALHDRVLLAPRACLIPHIGRSRLNNHDQLPLMISICENASFAQLEVIEALIQLEMVTKSCALTFCDHSGLWQPDPFADIQPTDWEDIMPLLPCIRVADFCGHCAVHALQLLTDAAGGDAFHAITDITVEDVSFVPQSKPRHIYQKVKPAWMSFETLVQAINNRIHPDRPESLRLHHIELKSCDIDDDQVSQLRRDFGEDFVAWDGRSRGARGSV
ncbi:hypothetical protein PENSPDRAFT_751786 [Peniophora sp. CONT]|nr:hypothetical protein PENSPDRAFT_751786 [Peniophora sp. CONT]